MLPKLTAFYFSAVLPELASPRNNTISGIREPGIWFKETPSQQTTKTQKRKGRKKTAKNPSELEDPCTNLPIDIVNKTQDSIHSRSKPIGNTNKTYANRNKPKSKDTKSTIKDIPPPGNQTQLPANNNQLNRSEIIGLNPQQPVNRNLPTCNKTAEPPTPDNKTQPENRHQSSNKQIKPHDKITQILCNVSHLPGNRQTPEVPCAKNSDKKDGSSRNTPIDTRIPGTSCNITTRLRRSIRVKFEGRRISHKWLENDDSGIEKWYSGTVVGIVSGKDGDPSAVYEVLYDNEDQPCCVDHLFEDYQSSCIKFIDL